MSLSCFLFYLFIVSVSFGMLMLILNLGDWGCDKISSLGLTTPIPSLYYNFYSMHLVGKYL